MVNDQQTIVVCEYKLGEICIKKTFRHFRYGDIIGRVTSTVISRRNTHTTGLANIGRLYSISKTKVKCTVSENCIN